MTHPSIHSLHVYPIKSCQGIDLTEAELVATGIHHDRHWMLINAEGQFLSQRSHPQLALVKPRICDESLRINIPGYSDHALPLAQTESPANIEVSIWKDQCIAAETDPTISEIFSDFLGESCRLVYLPDNKPRQVDRRYAAEGKRVGFADGFPLLVLSLASIDTLNSRLNTDYDINRFRANIVIAGCSAHEEDNWQAIEADGLRIDLLKPCSRCVIPSIDQKTAEKSPQLLKELAQYRHIDGKILVGQNGIHRVNGWLSVGQAIQPVKK